MRKNNFYKILFLISFWLFCTFFIVFYEAAVLDFNSEIEGGEYSFSLVLVTAALACIVGASLLGSIDVLYLSKLLRKKPFGFSILIRTFLYLMFILFFTSISRIYIVSSEINQPMFSKEVALHLKEEVIEKISLFKNVSNEFKREISLLLKPIFLTPGDYIFKAGDQIQKENQCN